MISSSSVRKSPQSGRKTLLSKKIFTLQSRTDFDDATSVLSVSILDNTLSILDNSDNIGLVRGDVTANEAHIK